jgi:hypothetical protein
MFALRHCTGAMNRARVPHRAPPISPAPSADGEQGSHAVMVWSDGTGFPQGSCEATGWDGTAPRAGPHAITFPQESLPPCPMRYDISG